MGLAQQTQSRGEVRADVGPKVAARAMIVLGLTSLGELRSRQARPLMRAEGLEPPHRFRHQDLNLACLPISPRAHGLQGGGRGPAAAEPGQDLHAGAHARRLSRLEYGRPMPSVRKPSPDVVITHPNRESAGAKSTRAVVIVLQVASAILTLFLAVAGWSTAAGAMGLWIVIGLLFGYFAYAVVNWRSGVLPIVAGLAIVSGVFAAVSVPSWFDRGGTGYNDPLLPESLIGVLVFGFAVLQLVNLVVSLKAFQQQWQVELEVPRDELHPGAFVANPA